LGLDALLNQSVVQRFDTLVILYLYFNHTVSTPDFAGRKIVLPIHTGRHFLSLSGTRWQKRQGSFEYSVIENILVEAVF
jgi:hypothetical protein